MAMPDYRHGRIFSSANSTDQESQREIVVTVIGEN